MPNFLNWVLIVIGALLMLVEVVLGAMMGFDFLLVGSAILLGGVLGLVTGSPSLGVAAAGVLSLLYVFFGRSKVRDRLRRPGIPSNTDALLGRVVHVVEAIAPDRPGRIKIEGEEWRAHLDSGIATGIEPGQNARVSRIDGVTVYVAPVEGSSGGASS